MAVDYSGLQQSQTMLEQAKLQEAGAVSKGLEEGFKPLQKQLELVAEKKEKREAQLKLDQGKAIEYMQEMADTSGLLGQYEPIVTELAKDVKFELNAIAQDESLNSFEKSAKYREVVQGFNKKASRFAREQELTTAFNEAFATGKLSDAIDPNSDDYKIAAALSNGKYEVNKDGTYIIEGVAGKIDSKRLKEIYLPLKTVDANEVSKTIGDIGANAKNANQIEVELRNLATEIGTIDAGKEFLIDGGFMDFEGLEKEMEGIKEKDQLNWLRNKIVEKGKGIANYVFLEKQPPVIPLGDAGVMAVDYYNTLADAVQNKNWSALVNMDYLGGKITSAEEVDGRLVLSFLDKSGRTYSTKNKELNIDGGGFKINDEFLRNLGNALIENGEGTATHLQKVQSEFIRLLNTPTVSDNGDDEEVEELEDDAIDSNENEMKAGEYPEEFNQLSTTAITGGDKIREAFKKYGLVASNTGQRRDYADKYGGTITLQNLAKFAFDRGGREEYNTNLTTKSDEMTNKVDILKDYNSASSTEKADETTYDINEVKKIMKTNKLGNFPGTDYFTKKDLALINYLKAGFKKENLDSDLALIDGQFN
jgi:hypothetical protein